MDSKYGMEGVTQKYDAKNVIQSKEMSFKNIPFHFNVVQLMNNAMLHEFEFQIWLPDALIVVPHIVAVIDDTT